MYCINYYTKTIENFYLAVDSLFRPILRGRIYVFSFYD